MLGLGGYRFWFTEFGMSSSIRSWTTSPNFWHGLGEGALPRLDLDFAGLDFHCLIGAGRLYGEKVGFGTEAFVVHWTLGRLVYKSRASRP